MSRRGGRDDSGQLTLLIIGYTALALVLVVVGVGASRVFLARRALASAADAAALAGAQGVDRAALYAGAGTGCGASLPLDSARAGAAARAALDAAEPGLRSSFAALTPALAQVAAGTVTVRLGGDVRLPFAGLLSALVPGAGTVHIDVTAAAQSPVADAGGC